MLGIQHIVLAVNKMDLIDWDREQFEDPRRLHAFAARLDVHDVTTIPLSALNGDNVVTKSDGRRGTKARRCCLIWKRCTSPATATWSTCAPVQYVIRPQTREHQDHRSYAGTVASGVMRTDDEVVVLPAGKSTRITAIEAGRSGRGSLPPMAVSISLADDIDISRGDDRPAQQPAQGDKEFDAAVCWMADESALEPGRDYLIKHTTRTTRVRVTALDYRLDVNTLHRDKTRDRAQTQ